SPTNWLILIGCLGFFGYLACIIFVLWPRIFPPDEDAKPTSNTDKPKIVSLKVGPGFSAVDVKDPVPPRDNIPSQKQGGGGAPGGGGPGGGIPGGGGGIGGGGSQGGGGSAAGEINGGNNNQAEEESWWADRDVADPTKTTIFAFDMGDLG